MKTDNPKLLIAGCGHWGRNYLRIFAGRLGPDRITVADPSCSVRDGILRQYGSAVTCSSIEAALKQGGFGMAVISTPAATHYGLIRKCLDAGLDVLAEKPLTLKTAEAEALAALARRKRRILMVGHTFIYNPAVRKMRELLAAGECGKLYYMKATRTHLGLVRPDVNAVWDLAPHDVSIFNHLTGSVPLSVSATGGCYLDARKEDVAFITLKYPGNVLASIHVSWADSNKARTVEVVGSRARIVFDDLNALERVKVFEKGISANVAGADTFGEFLFALRDGDIVSPKIPSSEPLAALCEEFLDCVKTRRTPLTGPREAVDVVRVMCAIDRSLKSGGKTIPIASRERKKR